MAGIGLTVAAPLWVPATAAIDLVRGRRRCPTTRLLAFGWAWSWLELAGVAAAFVLWATGRSADRDAHYRLQRWWAANLMSALRRTTGLTVAVDGLDALSPSAPGAPGSPASSGPAVMLCRHCSLADSLVSAWVVTNLAGKRPRYVLKRELLADPCLDVVGHRLPNHFLDREAADSAGELAALRALTADLGPDDIAIIFPEGTRATDDKRVRSLARIAERDPARAERLAPLTHLLPPRPAGTAALLAGAPDADVVIAWHTGFEGFDTFGRILGQLARQAPRIRFAAIRIPRSDVPPADGSTGSAEAITAWLDHQWLLADRAVSHLRAEPRAGRDADRDAPVPSRDARP